MGKFLQSCSGLFVLVAVIAHLIAFVRLVEYQPELEKVHTSVVNAVLPMNRVLDDPNLTIEEKQKLALEIGDIKAESLRKFAQRRSSGLKFDGALLLGSLFAFLAIGALMNKAGKRFEEQASEAAEARKLEEQTVFLAAPETRNGNPFKKGEVSEKLLPRGEFWKKRNKFRKTTERPNSDGY